MRVRTGFTVQRTYPDPRVEYYEPCKDLSAVLNDLGLTNAFNNPRPHRVRLQ
ncbi:MAG: hypothetical protein ACREQK_12090 [Candidatus Binatia bacterium]